ncbi:crossover junction endodeoxyribonuclease RuvC [Citroniella saccharovorans]|uniref:Crossover junction endodeoxyribonuclease RuvC n=1 Tax=Citroniella saccharovorans TaxID=2053367 RepID=A0AAW9MUE4_9FIRM|nr:crossover junction endodeoxyribonuclease RuvC [Citroniella saccharovorans]MEB3429746.1 crossover junction endodeoxyribonuclease RuvC [Citroniella saccharovorans]
MIILGIDPGLATIGYGVIEAKSRISLVEYGIIQTLPTSTLPERLEIIFKNIDLLIKDFNPDEVAIEELFFNKNVKTAITVGEARGVILVSLKLNSVPIYEYTPLQIKSSIAGYGRAEKLQVQNQVKNILSLKDIPKPDDASDALAVAMTHYFQGRNKEMFLIK